MKDYTFEEIQELNNKDYSCLENFLTENSYINIKKARDIFIEELIKKYEGLEVNSSFNEQDFDQFDLITLKLVYSLVADDYENVEDYANLWSNLYHNYISAFAPERQTKIKGLINLLNLKNNTARIITLLNYIIFKKENDYKMVSESFIKAFMSSSDEY